MKAEMTRAALDVLAERRRQVEAEGWTPEHDDRTPMGELAYAGEAYIGAFRSQVDLRPRELLVKAVALILAEIERLDRQELAEETAHLTPEGRSDGR